MTTTHEPRVRILDDALTETDIAALTTVLAARIGFGGSGSTPSPQDRAARTRRRPFPESHYRSPISWR